jgi:sterol desaturase/sphingolipid hydroxylase (fatty acid hydroxylase superfamily)
MLGLFTLPVLCIYLAGGVLGVLERLYPGRQLPEAPGWYFRALIFNSIDVIVLTLAGILFDEYFRSKSLFHITDLGFAPLEIFLCLLTWSFIFYWWHRAAHLNGLWHIFHQMHHSPSRIEVATTFYKHPVEAVFETALTAVILYLILGASAADGAWVGAIICMIGFFSHSNLRTPIWMGYFIQRPEHHSIHHQYDVHAHNYADMIIWDRIFGTFREAHEFTERCGFNGNNEARVGELLRFKDIYK